MNHKDFHSRETLVLSGDFHTQSSIALDMPFPHIGETFAAFHPVILDKNRRLCGSVGVVVARLFDEEKLPVVKLAVFDLYSRDQDDCRRDFHYSPQEQLPLISADMLEYNPRKTANWICPLEQEMFEDVIGPMLFAKNVPPYFIGNQVSRDKLATWGFNCSDQLSLGKMRFNRVSPLTAYYTWEQEGLPQSKPASVA